MVSTEATPRYRNFSNNMPLSTIVTPRAGSSLITVEKEPERDPEEDCFMCRQAHLYIKPIGMQQERRVGRRLPPPLTRTQIEELSRKKHLTKQEVRKLLQCYFPEIKNVKSFQLHKYHSCCYDPKHLNLCKNHITALQHEREQHPNHSNHNYIDENHYKDYEREGGPQNRVSFVRIKIEPTKGIPTRFLGPTALPESLADMLIQQVNSLEEKKRGTSLNSNYISQPYSVRRIENPYGSDDDDEEEEEDEDDSEDDDDDDDQPTGEVMAKSNKNHGNNKRTKAKSKTTATNGDIVVEDLDELNRLYINRDGPKRSDNDQRTFTKPLKRKIRKKGKKKKNPHTHRKPKLNHWELMALEQSKQEPCNCRHHVMRLEADQVVYDWCRCKDHQHKDLMERRKSISLPTPSPPEEPRQPTPPPPPPPPSLTPQTLPPPRVKRRKVRKRSIGIDATEPTMTELALAYDPSAVDYDMIQEAIYYRTSSGRLIKPEITNAFTYDTMPQAINTMTLNPNEPIPNKAEVLYMTPNGRLQPFEGGLRRRGRINDRSTPPGPVIVKHPGSLYNGQAYIDTQHSSSNTRDSSTMPVLRLPPSVASSTRYSNDNNTRYQPTEFTLATFSPDKSTGTPVSPRSSASDSQHPAPPGLQGKSRTFSMSKQKSTKPTYSNLEPTPDYGRESSVLANRRWFDQPLGDQNLRSVHDGQYGLIAGTSTGQYQAKSQLPDNDYTEANTPTNKNGGNCTIS